MTITEVSVRPVRQRDLRAIERVLTNRPSFKHRERLAAQRRGEAVYLIAWDGSIPVGHATLRWPGMGVSARGQWEGCAEVSDLHVAARSRGRGVGAHLLQQAERETLGRGLTKMGLGVGIDNERALALYRRCGYEDAGYEPFVVSGMYWGDDGKEHHRSETCWYFTKCLVPS